VAGLLILNAVVALFYYLRVAYLMWMRQPRLGAPILQPGIALSFILLVLMVATVVLGLLPGLVTDSTSVTSVLAGS
jgi:NADH-quinone oxidoreductase subunit N